MKIVWGCNKMATLTPCRPKESPASHQRKLKQQSHLQAGGSAGEVQAANWDSPISSP